MATKTTSIPANGKFSLPTLSPLPSLTSGTNIPPPPPSPPPATPTVNVPAKPAHEVTSTSNQAADVSKTDATTSPPLSPTNAGRPGSLRRLLSGSSLNSKDRSPGHARTASIASTSSPAAASAKARRLWFRKKAATNSVDEDANSTKEQGSPPPKLPELRLEGADKGMNGVEMFGNIK